MALRACVHIRSAADKPVVYISLGSMLGAYYDNPPAILKVFADGVAAVQRGGARCRAVIHTVTGARRGGGWDGCWWGGGRRRLRRVCRFSTASASLPAGGLLPGPQGL
jgi:hypothetical protein